MVSIAAKKVRERLTELGWNHAELARRMKAKGVNVAEGLVSRWLSGKRSPDLLRGTVLDELLELDVAKLWTKPVRGKAA